jgi:hypothetical protein
LHHVFGVVRTEHSRRVAIEGPLDLPRELLECARVTVSGSVEERTARFIGRIHQRCCARFL